MDAFAVALASGIALKNVDFRQTFRLGWHFGFFQFAMPVLGWSLGLGLYSFIQAFDHWIAFFFLSFIGIRMILGGLGECESEGQKDFHDPTKGMTMVSLSIATSIDAFAVGLSLSLLQVSIWFPAAIIGVVACVLTTVGLHIGRWVGSCSRIGDWANLLGGFILVAIGIHILYEHKAFAFLFAA